MEREKKGNRGFRRGVALPPHFKQSIVRTPAIGRVSGIIQGRGLYTVCQEARCPNRNHCYSEGTATFLILGGSCTRSCRFCAVAKSQPAPPDPGEPEQVAWAASEMGLKYTVITSVTRDDLGDGGSGHFVRVMNKVRERNPGVSIEVLTPDFQGSQAAIDRVAAARPEVFNHNLETVARLYPTVRPQADYRRSLNLLERVSRAGLTAKSGLMVGLGESREEIKIALADLSRAGCSIVTIGQYLAPSPLHHPVDRYWDPEEFEECRAYGQDGLGLRAVVAGPLVRSSYRARQTFQDVNQQLRQQFSP